MIYFRIVLWKLGFSVKTANKSVYVCRTYVATYYLATVYKYVGINGTVIIRIIRYLIGISCNIFPFIF